MSEYDEDYYLRGRESGKSLYENYHWMPELTMPMVQKICMHLNIHYTDTVLDFGAARGYTVRALRELGYRAFGLDCSEWAVANADPSIKDCMLLGTSVADCYDWIIAKDVLEHIGGVEMVIHNLMYRSNRGIFAVVPLSLIDGEPYVIPDYEKDITHVQRLSLATWAGMFIRPGWTVECRYRVNGVKDNWYKEGWERANGFITARRMV